jgi:hypothetical protein
VNAVSRRPSRDDLDRAELQVRLVLRDTDLDMQGQIRISRTPEAVRVEDSSGPADGRAAAASRIGAIPHVRLDVHAGDLSGVTTRPESTVSRLGLRHWRGPKVSKVVTLEAFLSDLTRSLATVRQRLAILSEVATRFPHPQSQMSASARGMLKQLVDRHYQCLRAELNDSRVSIAAHSGSVTVDYDATITPPRLVAHAPVALSKARTLEELVRNVIAGDDLAPADSDRINAAFGALWRAVHAPDPADAAGSPGTDDLATAKR